MREILIIVLLLLTGKSFSQNNNGKKPEISIKTEFFTYTHANGGLANGMVETLYVGETKVGYPFSMPRYKSELLKPFIQDCDSAEAVHNKAINEFKTYRKKKNKIQVIIIPTIVTGVALGALIGIWRDQPAYFPIFGFGFAIPVLAITRKPLLKNKERYKKGRELVTKTIEIYNNQCR